MKKIIPSEPVIFRVSRKSHRRLQDCAQRFGQSVSRLLREELERNLLPKWEKATEISFASK